MVGSSAIERGYRKYFRSLRAVLAVLLWRGLTDRSLLQFLVRSLAAGRYWLALELSKARYDLELSRQHQPRSAI